MPDTVRSAPPPPRTLFDRIWQSHLVHVHAAGPTLLYIDRHYLSDDLPTEVYRRLAARGLQVRRPQNTVAMPDHYAPSAGGGLSAVVDAERRDMVRTLARQSRAHGILHFGLDDRRQGIIHVTATEQGLSLPGMTVVCADSHTTTHGAFGALGFGIGATEAGHVLATQTLWQSRPRTMAVRFDGRLTAGVSAKDMALAMIRRIGVAGASGHVIEYGGDAVSALSMEGRMTLCNLSIEAGARAGLVAPDAVTFAYLRGRPFASAPSGSDDRTWAERCRRWQALASDADAVFDRTIHLDVGRIEPMVTWGTDPSQSSGIGGVVPDGPDALDDRSARSDTGAARRREAFARALDYMGLHPGQPLAGLPIDRVFIGSCTNGRIEDLRDAAAEVRGHRARVPTLIVPGSGLVRRQAEHEGLDRVFRDAGMQWGSPGCSMCLAINGDQGRPGERVVSTTNRNFVGRQGPGVRTHLASPATAAAAAVHGHLVDIRRRSVDGAV